MKKLAIVNTLLLLAVFMVGFSNSASAQCGASANPSNTCTGSFSGFSVVSGTRNSFYGRSSGQNLTTGDSNAFYGTQSGFSSDMVNRNSFFGSQTGNNNVSGNRNAFFGALSGSGNVTGSFNSYFGDATGLVNATGNYITLFGSGANVSVDGLSFASAFGAGAIASASNTIQLGRNTFDTVRIGKLASGGTTPVCLNANMALSSCPAPLASKGGGDELRSEVDVQSRKIREQQGQIEALRNTICSMNAKAAVCRQ